MMADVEAMFHQVRVQPEDCDALRFLWWPDNDLARDPEEYQMMVHLFGSVSSPSCANFALRRTADDNSEHFDPEVVNTVKRNFHVDNMPQVSQQRASSHEHGQATACSPRQGWFQTDEVDIEFAKRNQVSTRVKKNRVRERNPFHRAANRTNH